ncbi:hypothetical protein [Pseudobdellovibrio exovorus]|uniref:hypothetical protein n=1 Tax=Pseudobdellovibrio exovorus TaxID=453816 RepID=UPI0005A1E0E7|nr:hypothetical protein [Pseudobdellovibrio exovorus]
MNESKLIFYGQEQDIRQHMLYVMNFVEVRPVEDNKSGFFIQENRYGQLDLKKIDVDYNFEQEVGAVLLYRYLSEAEKEKISSQDSLKRYYVLSHKHFDLSYLEELGIAATQTIILCGHLNSTALKDRQYISRQFKTKNISILKMPAIKTQKVKTKTVGLPLIFLLFLKFFVNPINEAKGFFERVKHSNVRLVYRFFELLSFLGFVCKAIIWKYILIFLGGLWKTLNYGFVLVKIVAIKIAYGVRHLLLMMGFKSFGIFIDSYHAFVRVWDRFMDVFVYKFLYRIYFNYIFKGTLFLYHQVLVKSINFIFYKIILGTWAFFKIYIWNFIFYKVFMNIWAFLKVYIWNFIFYKIIMNTWSYLKLHVWNFLYYKVGYFLYYRVFYYLYFVLITGAINFIKYDIRHFFLMCLYKGYGLIYDLSTFLYRITKLYLLYPIRKVYWFCNYQYNTRVKRLMK